MKNESFSMDFLVLCAVSEVCITNWVTLEKLAESWLNSPSFGDFDHSCPSFLLASKLKNEPCRLTEYSEDSTGFVSMFLVYLYCSQAK